MGGADHYRIGSVRWGTMTPGLLERADFARAPLYETLRRHCELRPTSAEETLAAASAEASIAATLGIELGAPILRLTRLTRNARGEAFEFVRSVYRGDAFMMKVRLEVGEA